MEESSRERRKGDWVAIAVKRESEKHALIKKIN